MKLEGSRDVGQRTADRQRNGRLKDIIRIVVPLGLDESSRIAAVASHHAVRLFASGEQVGICAGKRQRIEGVTCGANPLPMPLLLGLVRPVVARGENFDERRSASPAS